MGFKKKRIDHSDDRLIELFEKIKAIIIPLFDMKGILDINNFGSNESFEYLLALFFNLKFASNSVNSNSVFCADDIIPIQMEVENSELLKMWGKIYWLSIINGHECYKSFQDPFYAEFRLNDNKIEITNITFGDYDKTDLDGRHWLSQEINWMYEL